MSAHRLDRLHEHLEQNVLWHRWTMARQTWTPSVGFGLIVCLVIGLNLISERVQHLVTPTDAYAVLSHHHSWAIGVLFVALYAVGVLSPARGALIAVTLFCIVGFLAALPTLNAVGLIFYIGLCYTAVTTTMRKQKLLRWVRVRRAVYEHEKRYPKAGGKSD